MTPTADEEAEEEPGDATGTPESREGAGRRHPADSVLELEQDTTIASRESEPASRATVEELGRRRRFFFRTGRS
jgi:hypothetical protein